jgi:hypothetical protein
MSDTALDQEEAGFAFTDEDYARRYSPDKPRAAAAPAAPAPQPAPQPAKRIALHGGGNSFMRARRRRLSTSGSA